MIITWKWYQLYFGFHGQTKDVLTKKKYYYPLKCETWKWEQL